MGLEKNHKGYLSPFPFSQKCQLLQSSEAPNKVTRKVKCSDLPYAYAECQGVFLSHSLGAVPFLSEHHFYKQGLQML